MHHSSTSSSETRGRPRWAVWCAATALLLAGAEGLLRLPSLQSWLPTRTHYYDAGVAVREDALKTTLAAHGHVDVLFIGSSIVRTNIQPLTFDGLVQRRTGYPVISFNAGLSGLWPGAVVLYLEHVWLPLAKPRLVVQGIRYPELAATTHALQPHQVFSGRVEAAWTKTTGVTRAYSAAASRIRLLQYRGTLTRVLERYSNGRPGPLAADGREFGIDPRGYTPRLPTLREARARGLAKDEEPVSEGVCLPDGCRVGFTALSRAIAAVRRSGADYLLVNIPEHGTRWRGEDGRRRYHDYLRALRAFARSEGVRFVDPTEGDPYTFQNDVEYSDTYHMSPAGAARLTSILAARIDPRVGTVGRRHVTVPATVRGAYE